ncbi:hypothetical protein D3C76_1669560 [compost metagenome]
MLRKWARCAKGLKGSLGTSTINGHQCSKCSGTPKPLISRSISTSEIIRLRSLR